jgi:hypothetical protein
VEAVRSIRIHLPDRPGALSSIGTALAVHGVNIARLHVVSHEGETVIDDLDLAATSAHAISRAIAGFHHDVRVECFDSAMGDPVLAVAHGIGAVAAAASCEAALQALAGWALSVVRADAGAIFEVAAAGVRPVAGAPSGALSTVQSAALRAAAESDAGAALPPAAEGPPLRLPASRLSTPLPPAWELRSCSPSRAVRRCRSPPAKLPAWPPSRRPPGASLP